MLKKTIFALLSSTTAIALASNSPDNIQVAPYQPSNWGYINATISTKQLSVEIRKGITIPIPATGIVSITDVIAMNAHPKIDASCYDIKVKEQGLHQIWFELKSNWIVYCRSL